MSISNPRNQLFWSLMSSTRQTARQHAAFGFELGACNNKMAITIDSNSEDNISVWNDYWLRTVIRPKNVYDDDEDLLGNGIYDDGHWYAGKPVLWTPVKIFKVTFVLFLSVFGTLGNALIIGAVMAEKRLKHVGNAFIINMAVADLLVTTWMLPEMTANIIAEDRVLPSAVCVFSSFLDVTSCLVSLSSSGLIAYDRYLVVCHEQLYRKLMTKNTVFFIIFLSWLEPLVLCMPAWLAGSAQFAYDHRNDLCAVDHAGSAAWFNAVFIVVGMLLPMCVCFYSYFRLFLVVRQSRKRVQAHSNQQAGHSKKRKTDIEMFATLFIAFMVLVIFWSPYSFTVFLEEMRHMEVPHDVFRGFAYLSQSSCAVNGFLYGLTSRHFRRGYVLLFKRFVRRCRRVLNYFRPYGNEVTITDTRVSESNTNTGY